MTSKNYVKFGEYPVELSGAKKVGNVEGKEGKYQVEIKAKVKLEPDDLDCLNTVDLALPQAVRLLAQSSHAAAIDGEKSVNEVRVTRKWSPTKTVFDTPALTEEYTFTPKGAITIKCVGGDMFLLATLTGETDDQGWKSLAKITNNSATTFAMDNQLDMFSDGEESGATMSADDADEDADEDYGGPGATPGSFPHYDDLTEREHRVLVAVVVDGATTRSECQAMIGDWAEGDGSSAGGRAVDRALAKLADLSLIDRNVVPGSAARHLPTVLGRAALNTYKAHAAATGTDG